MAKTIIKEHVVSHGPFMLLMNLLTSSSMRIVETKNEDEKAITVRIPPAIVDRLDSYAKTARISRSFLLRILIEGALDEMDELVIKQNERYEEEYENMIATAETISKEKKEKEDRAKALLEHWQTK